jgi:cell division protein ZapA (FtsZ GTPase activity inhibitor)
MIIHYLKAKILVFGVFFIGIATGVLIANFYTTHVASAPDTVNSQERVQRAQRDINRFFDYVGLNDMQRDEVRKIAEESRRQIRELREETQPKLHAIQEKSRATIRALLNADQQKKYDEFIRRKDARLRERNQTLKKNRESEQFSNSSQAN